MFDMSYPKQSERFPVWALHGSAASPRQWRHLEAVIGESREFNAVDAPGYGDVRRTGAPGLASRAQPLIAAIEASGGPVHWVGHSFGGAVALKIAEMRPDLVASLVLYEPMVPTVLKDQMTEEERKALSDVDALSARLTAAIACGAPADGMAAFTSFWAGEAALFAMGPERRARMSGFAVPVAQDFSDARADDLTFASLARIAVPTTVITGTASPAVVRVIARRLAVGMPEAFAVTLSGADHMTPVNEPERVNRIVLAHVSQHEALRMTGNEVYSRVA